MSSDELVENLTELFHQLESGISEEEDAIKGLQALLVRVKEDTSQSFDKTDIGWITETLEQRTSKRDWLKSEITTKRNKYEGSYMRLKKVVETRIKILEDMDSAFGVLGKNPELKAKLVKKQADLMMMLKSLSADVTEKH